MRADRSTKLLLVILSAMFLQQTFATLGRSLPPIIAPADPGGSRRRSRLGWRLLRRRRRLALFAQMGCGSFIIRYGALRMSQVALVLLGGGMAVATAGGVLLASAVIGGGARLSPPRPARNCSGFATPPGAAGVFDQADGRAGGHANLRLSGPGDGGRSGMARRDTGDGGRLAWPLRRCCNRCGREFDDDRVPSRRFRLSDFRTTDGLGSGAPRPSAVCLSPASPSRASNRCSPPISYLRS